MIKGGYYLKARRIQESEIAHAPPHTREIWDWLIKEANHKTNGAIRRGQCLRSIQDIRDGLSWKVGYRTERYSKSQCENSMKYLRRGGMIATAKAARGMVVTVLKYNVYQNPANYESRDECRNECPSHAPPLPNHKQECKNGKNVNKDLISTFDYWRETCNHPQAKLTPARRDKIRLRLKDFSVDKLQLAIKNCSESDYHVENGYTWLVKNILKNREKVEWWLERGRKKSASEHRLEELQGVDK